MKENKETFLLEVEILDLSVNTVKEFLEKISISYYEDFLIKNVVFIRVSSSIRDKLMEDPKLKIHKPTRCVQI